MTLETLCGHILGDHGSSPIYRLFLRGKMIAEQKTLLAADIDKKYSKARGIQNKIFSSLQRCHKNPQTPPKTSQSPNICHLKRARRRVYVLPILGVSSARESGSLKDWSRNPSYSQQGAVAPF